MNTEPRVQGADDATDTAAPLSTARAPAKPSVTETLRAWPMKPFSFHFQQKGLLVILAALLVVTVVLAAVLLIGTLTNREIWNSTSWKLSLDLPFDWPWDKPADKEGIGGVAAEEGAYPYADGVSGEVLLPWSQEADAILSSQINSSYAVLADLSTGEIIASRKADSEIYPASMTKVMTLIVVVENLPREDCLQDSITISEEVYNRMDRAGASGIGMEPGETLTVESLLYALMLRSDGIAACELAKYVAGSEEDFVELMNQKAAKMGLTKTHFENPTGLHHENHKSTSREIASIMAYAMNMKLCRRILKTQSYNAACTGADGKIFHYNLYHNLTVTQFAQVTPNQPSGVTVAAGKTGFTDESRYCLVTYAESADGHGYVCVTAEGDSYKSCISDYITVYNTYIEP